MITVLNDKAIAVEVKPDWTKFSIWVAQHSLRGHKKGFNYLQYFEGEHPIYDLIELHPGSYSILGRPEEITEDQWKGVVGERKGLYGLPLFKDYTANELTENDGFALVAANMSGHSLLKSKGLQDKSIIILQKQ